MGSGDLGVQGQRADQQRILYPTRAFRKELLLLQKKLRTQILDAVPELVSLEGSPAPSGELRIRYRGAESTLPEQVDMDTVAALLRSIQSL